MPDLAPPASLDLFDRPEAADLSALAPLSPLLDAELLRETRPHYAALPTPYYDSPNGQLRLYQADALELLRRMRDESVDMVFADPPYFLSNGGITCVGGRMVSVDKGGWDKSQGIIGDHNFNILWLDQCRRILKPNGTLWVTGTSHYIHSVGYALQVLDYKILNDIAWYKVNPPPNLSCRYFTHDTETVLWAAKSAKSKHIFHYDEMKRDNGGKQMQSLWHIMPPGKSEKRHGKHPTQKPEALLMRIVAASTHSGDLVLDPFCGSATTGVAAARLGRRFIGIEREWQYLELAFQRLCDGQKSFQTIFVFIEQPQTVPHCYDARVRETWKQTVLYALTSLGGEGHLRDINRIIADNARTKSNRTWPCTIRRTIRQSAQFVPVGRGTYRLS